MLENVEQRNTLLTSIERARNSSVIAYFLHDNAVIADDALPHLYDKLQALGKKERIDLLIYARGGMVEVCWRVINLLRDYCDHLGVIVGTRAQGAAALLPLGADEIVVGSLSELGGIESARKHPLLPHDEAGQSLPVTWGEMKSFMSFLEARGEGRGAGEDGMDEQQALSPKMAAALFQHVHPLVIAQLQQSDTLSREITRRALRLHMHPENLNQIEQVVELFNGGFHSHFYTVSPRELVEMGLPVTQIEGELWSSVWSLAQLYQAALYNERPDPLAPGAFFRYVCVIESVGRSTGLRQVFTQVEGQERVLQVRWETAIRSPGPGPSFGPGGSSNN
ncbi:MAG TPA: hypothetical protein VEX13_16015 [Chloroflexia bacterium]|nr:hypothetical protein [Chloroflexia bacterium]